MELDEATDPAVPGMFLRLAFLGGALTTGAVVASAALGLTTTHWGLAGVALPLLTSSALLARFAYPSLAVRATAALLLLLVAVALGGVVALSGSAEWAMVLHVGAAGIAFGAALIAAASAFRGTPAPLASIRDYLTLTKPRIMSLLLVTGA